MAWKDIIADPEFQSQPVDVQMRVAQNYFTKEIASDPGFSTQAQEVQDQVLSNFFDTVRPKSKTTSVLRKNTGTDGLSPFANQVLTGNSDSTFPVLVGPFVMSGGPQTGEGPIGEQLAKVTADVMRGVGHTLPTSAEKFLALAQNTNIAPSLGPLLAPAIEQIQQKAIPPIRNFIFNTLLPSTKETLDTSGANDPVNRPDTFVGGLVHGAVESAPEFMLFNMAGGRIAAKGVERVFDALVAKHGPEQAVTLLQKASQVAQNTIRDAASGAGEGALFGTVTQQDPVEMATNFAIAKPALSGAGQFLRFATRKLQNWSKLPEVQSVAKEPTAELEVKEPIIGSAPTIQPEGVRTIEELRALTQENRDAGRTSLEGMNQKEQSLFMRAMEDAEKARADTLLSDTSRQETLAKTKVNGIDVEGAYEKVLKGDSILDDLSESISEKSPNEFETLIRHFREFVQPRLGLLVRDGKLLPTEMLEINKRIEADFSGAMQKAIEFRAGQAGIKPVREGEVPTVLPENTATFDVPVPAPALKGLMAYPREQHDLIKRLLKEKFGDQWKGFSGNLDAIRATLDDYAKVNAEAVAKMEADRAEWLKENQPKKEPPVTLVEEPGRPVEPLEPVDRTHRLSDEHDPSAEYLYSGLHPNQFKILKPIFNRLNDPDKSRALKSVVRGVFEFFQPGSMMPEGEKWLDLRNSTTGFAARGQKLSDTLTRRYASLTNVQRGLIMQQLDGKISMDELPTELRPVAARFRRIDDMMGDLLLGIGAIKEKRPNHIRYVMEQFSNKQNLGGRTLHPERFSARKNLTEAERQEYGLVDDPVRSLAESIMLTTKEVANFGYLKGISHNMNWIFPHSVITIPDRYSGFGRAKTMGVGAAREEIARLAQNQRDGVINQAGVGKMELLKKLVSEAEKGTPGPRTLREYTMLKGSQYGPLNGVLVLKTIANDIKPLYEIKTGSDLVNFIKRAVFIQYPAMWKASKTALNPPTMGTNIISNIFQLNMSGTPLYEIPGLIAKAAQQMATKGPYYQAMVRNGLFHQNLTTEFRDLAEISRGIRKDSLVSVLDALEKVSSFYGGIDDFFKLAKAIEVMEKGGTKLKAAREGQKWGMDYSLAHPVVKYARQAPLGAPFITYQYKIMPLILESLSRNPWTITKWAMLPTFWNAAQMGKMTPENAKKFEDGMPRRMAYGQRLILPTEKGDTLDLTQIFPWGNLFESGMMLTNGEVSEAMNNMGVASNPIASVLRGLTTKEDRLGRKIISPISVNPSDKIKDALQWAWNEVLPVPSFLTKGSAAEKIADHIRYGRTQKVDPDAGIGVKTSWYNAYPRIAGVRVDPNDPLARIKETRGQLKSMKGDTRTQLRNYIIQVGGSQNADPEVVRRIVEKSVESQEQVIKKYQEPRKPTVVEKSINLVKPNPSRKGEID